MGAFRGDTVRQAVYAGGRALLAAEGTGDHGLRRGAIVERLLRELFQGRMRPGQHLVTRELADRFGVSHTPVREALIALSGMGMVDLLPNRGAVIRRVGARDIREICQVRRALECEAVRSACGRVAREPLAALAAELRRLADASRSEPGYLEAARSLDNRLHDLVAASCNNAFLASELGRLKSLFRAFRDAAWEREEGRGDLDRVAEEAGEHLAVVEALWECRRSEAARAMARHIDAGARYWSRVILPPPVPAERKPPLRRGTAEAPAV